MRRSNPFQELYLTEAVEDPDLFGTLFSPKVITGETKILFRVGNVVLLGSNGAGKSMLLRLFASDVQAAFLRSGMEDPIPSESRLFLGAGLNLLHAGFGALGRRSVSSDPYENADLWAVYMGDLLNYSLIGEIINTLRFLATDEGALLREATGSRLESDRIDELARIVASDYCWFGAMDHVRTLADLQSAVGERIYCYRSFANWNSEKLPDSVRATKTEIGAPLRVFRQKLASTGVLDSDIPLMITIDQYETLLHVDYERRSAEVAVGRAFCRVINALLAGRAPEVSYKIGARNYSWGRELRVFGGDARIEIGRDYHRVNLDETLRRKENVISYVFPEFADDVAARRLATYERQPAKNFLGWLPSHLQTLTPEQEVDSYDRKGSTNLLPRSDGWPEDWNNFLRELFAKNRYEAKLAEVWLRQVAGRGAPLPSAAEAAATAPWSGKWWKKERRDALLMQIASRARQRRLYGGWDALMTLSGSNILVFISLCREIWEVHERTFKGEHTVDVFAKPVPPIVQSQAIRVVSETWFGKQIEFPGGARRQDFVRRLGIGIRKGLLEDDALSNPGRNGFSLTMEEYESGEGRDVKEFLDTATDFGSLLASPHTTKERDKKPRMKWYLFPILCPHFEIPAIRTKEPYYATLSEAQEWISDARPPIRFAGRRARAKGGQRRLFGQGKLS